jgi:hypothetical protein
MEGLPQPQFSPVQLMFASRKSGDIGDMSIDQNPNFGWFHAPQKKCIVIITWNPNQSIRPQCQPWSNKSSLMIWLVRAPPPKKKVKNRLEGCQASVDRTPTKTLWALASFSGFCTRRVIICASSSFSIAAITRPKEDLWAAQPSLVPREKVSTWRLTLFGRQWKSSEAYSPPEICAFVMILEPESSNMESWNTLLRLTMA